jgi:hypothetical protein
MKIIIALAGLAVAISMAVAKTVANITRLLRMP